jgi:hypothetical protein
MNFLLAHHRLPSIFFGTLIILSIIVSFFLVKDVQQYRHYHQEVSRLTVNNVVHELQEIFRMDW